MEQSGYFFICHANKDKRRIAPVVRELVSGEVPVWIDKPQHPDLGIPKDALQSLADKSAVRGIEKGTYWDDAVLDALAGAAGVIAFCSRSALQSTEFLMEIGAAVATRRSESSRRKYAIFSVYLDGFSIRHGDFRTSRTQAFNYSGRNSKNRAWENTSLVRVCRSHLGLRWRD